MPLRPTIQTTGSHTVTVGKNDNTADFNTANYATDWGAVVAAYEFAKVNNKKTVFVKNGTYTVNNGPRLLYVGGISLLGESKEGVIIQGSRTTDWLLINLSGGVYYDVNGFYMENFTFDLQNGANASACRFYSVHNTTIKNCHFKNGAAGGWFISWGSEDHEDAGNRGTNNQEIDCTYDTHQGSLEMVLVYNQDYYRSIGATFVNKGTVVAGPILGLWQNCKNPQIISPRFIDCNGYNYYSITCDNPYFENIYAENTGAVLQGANVSDNTEFGPRTGIERVKGLVINGFKAIGGANSTTSVALQLGAVEDFDVTINYVEGYSQGVLFDRGNHQCFANSRRGRLKYGIIKNCNPNGTASAINPAIFFNGAGKYDITIEGGETFDDKTVKTQIHPVSFNEPHVEPVITFTVSSGVITGATIVSGGSGLPRQRSAVFPLVLNITGGTGAVVHAYTNWAGTVTSIVIVNGGSGFTTPVVGSIATETYGDITITGARLVSYSGQSSVHRLSTAIITDSVKFVDIRNATKGVLARNYAQTIQPSTLPRNSNGLVAGDLFSDNGLVKVVEFTPLSIGGLVTWINAENVELSGSVITQMNDLSGNWNHAIQATSGDRPNLVNSVVANRPVARFTSGQHFTFVSNGTFSTGVTQIVVFRPDATNSNNGFFSKSTSSDRAPFDGYIGGDNRFTWTYANAVSTNAVSTSNFSVLGASSTSGSHNYYLNGVTNGVAGGPSFGGGDTGVLRLGKAGYGSGTPFIGDIAEALLFNRKLTDTEILQISQWLMAKYAI